MLAALCLLTLPQSYKGGASLPHPHSIFQFWFHGGHASAAHHHDDGDDDHDHAVPAPLSPADAEAAARAARADTPTIAQMTPSSDSSDAIGGVLSSWIVLLLLATTGHYLVKAMRQGLTPSPESPPPKIALVST